MISNINIKKMNGYENGKIYKVTDKNDNIIYIGSTKLKLKVRWNSHHLKCNEYNIKLIENYPCESCEELRKAEQKFIELYNEMGLVNQRRAYCTEEERKDYHKKYDQSEKRKEYRKIYNQTEKYKEFIQSDEHKEQQKIKANCPNCEKLILKRYISTHTKLYCKNRPIDND